MPIHKSVPSYLRQFIREQRLKANSRLPSERFLLQTFGSSRVTIRETLGRLEAEGLIYRQNRKGWFVSPPRFQIDLTRKIDFTAMALAQSRVPSTEVLHIRRVTAPVKMLEPLELARGAMVYELRRVRALDGRPIMMEDIYLNARQFDGIELHDLNGSITRVQREQFGAQFTSELSTIRVVTLSEKQAGSLSVNPGAPCLNILRTRFDERRKPIDYNIEHWLHNSIEMTVDSR